MLADDAERFEQELVEQQQRQQRRGPIRGRGLLVLILVLGLAAAYLSAWPVAIDPAAWDPPPAPVLAGPYAPNTELSGVLRFALGDAVGAEDAAVDGEQRIYGGVEDGRIIRINAGGIWHEPFVNTHGRPLGLDFDRDGRLIVADADRGLLAVAPDGRIDTLAVQHGGVPFGFTNDVDVGSDGWIYFSDASDRFGFDQVMEELLEHRPNGRLLRYQPASGQTELLLDDLYFANGVAVAPDASFVLVVETGKYQVRRRWLTGARAGEDEVLVGNLPGFPDGISSNGRGIYWLALVAPRIEAVDRYLMPRPALRRVLLRLPKGLQPSAGSYGFVLGIDETGMVHHDLQDPAGGFSQISSVEEVDGYLYLGSLVEDAIGRVAAPTSSG